MLIFFLLGWQWFILEFNIFFMFSSVNGRDCHIAAITMDAIFTS